MAHAPLERDDSHHCLVRRVGCWKGGEKARTARMHLTSKPVIKANLACLGGAKYYRNRGKGAINGPPRIYR